MLGDNDIIASIDGRKNKATFDGGIKKKHLSSLQTSTGSDCKQEREIIGI